MTSKNVNAPTAPIPANAGIAPNMRVKCGEFFSIVRITGRSMTPAQLSNTAEVRECGCRINAMTPTQNKSDRKTSYTAWYGMLWRAMKSPKPSIEMLARVRSVLLTADHLLELGRPALGEDRARCVGDEVHRGAGRAH